MMLLVLVVICLLTYCGSDKSRSEQPVIGNTMPNILNQGFLAKDDEWFYQFDFDDLSLKRWRDGRRKETILKLNNRVESININNGWIYYLQEGINKVRVNGQDKTKLSSDPVRYMAVCGDWLYYSVLDYNLDSNDYCQFYYINRMKTDGTQKETIVSQRIDLKKVHDLNGSFYFYNNKIYYMNSSDKFRLHEINLDGSSERRVLNNTMIDDSGEALFNIVDGWIYFTTERGFKNNHLYGRQLVKTRLDGGSVIQLTDYAIWTLNVTNKNIYVVNENDDKVYKMDLDGSDSQQIGDFKAYFINIAGDRLFAQDADHDNIFYEIKLDKK